jgi:hypothetical protein
MNDRGRAYTLSRLRRERPDLFDRVKAKELSANAAAIEAGWRKQATPLDKIRQLLPKLSEAEVHELHVLVRDIDARPDEVADGDDSSVATPFGIPPPPSRLSAT